MLLSDCARNRSEKAMKSTGLRAPVPQVVFLLEHGHQTEGQTKSQTQLLTLLRLSYTAGLGNKVFAIIGSQWTEIFGSSWSRCVDVR